MTLKAWMPATALAAVLALAACSAPDTSGDSTQSASGDSDAVVRYSLDPYPSTYVPRASGVTLIQHATVIDGVGGQIENGDVLVENGRISAVGTGLVAPDGATVIDATGRYVTPGIIDIHSHLGDYPSPGVDANNDGNEMTSPVTPQVWAEHSVWPQDVGFEAALAGGVTTISVLPGSGNLFGGRGITLRNVAARTVQEMKFPGAPYTLKMACGENPSRVYGSRNQSPATDMGNMAGYRAAWQRATEYRRSWQEYWDSAEAGEDATPPTRDLGLDTLMGVLNGEILVEMHCYRADQMAQIIDLSHEFGYHVAAFHHAVEAYKIPDLLAAEGTCAAVWADWGGFKMEAYDSIRENLPMIHAGGACAMIHSDSEMGIQRLNQEVAKALADGRRAGIDISEADAWRWLTSNPATALGILDQTGSLEVGKRADIVLWSADPFSTYSRADRVWIDGALTYDRRDEDMQPVRDFMLGQPGEGDE
ncbi:amidohydrolase [uncultured Maricaulis sp.]|uniref:amidohydrolase n=1 Tax=uncultured Maricaulis sp. TaxID=174710 RepID=UPI0030DC181B|tara:strand:- start:14815 stop:16248 length:1434 start_codon:yes stop_codon:yes gene_type:complete